MILYTIYLLIKKPGFNRVIRNPIVIIIHSILKKKEQRKYGKKENQVETDWMQSGIVKGESWSVHDYSEKGKKKMKE